MQLHCTCHEGLHIELCLQTSIMLCSSSYAQISNEHCLAIAAVHAVNCDKLLSCWAVGMLGYGHIVVLAMDVSFS